MSVAVKVALAAAKRIAAAMAKVDTKNVAPLNAAIKPALKPRLSKTRPKGK